MSGHNDKNKNPYQTIFVTFILLAILTILEYFIPEMKIFEESSFVPLMIMAFLKAVLVVWNFMHVYRVWRGDDHH